MLIFYVYDLSDVLILMFVVVQLIKHILKLIFFATL